MTATRTTSPGQSTSPTRSPDAGAARRQGHLDQVGAALVEGEQPDQVADGHRLLDQGRHQPRRGDRDVDAPDLVEHPLVLRVVDPGHRSRHAELGLAPAATSTRLTLSSPVAAMATSQVSSPASSREDSSHASASSHSASGSVSDLIARGSRSISSTSWPFSTQLGGDRAADVAGAGDGDAHLSLLGGRCGEDVPRPRPASVRPATAA